jgi:flagellar assembly protein FliH
MSLSKYYKDSSSFQPEALIKREEKLSPGWQPLQPEKQLPFQSMPHPAASAPKVLPPENTPVEAGIETQQTVQTKNQPDVQPETPPKKQEIDLSKYLEITVADKKIEEAYQRGIQTGKDKVEQDFGTATKALLSACQQLDTIHETIISNSSEELQEIALSIAERILRISVREQDRTIVATIEEALQRAVKSDEFTIYIHPEDYKTVAENSAEIIAGLTGLNKIVIKKDITLERGGAKLESDNCTIDATITSQFDVIREEIKKNL